MSHDVANNVRPPMTDPPSAAKAEKYAESMVQILAVRGAEAASQMPRDPNTRSTSVLDPQWSCLPEKTTAVPRPRFGSDRRTPADPQEAADSGLPTTDTELSHPGLERGALEAQASRRPIWTGDHPVGRVERTKDCLALRHLEGLIAGRRDDPSAEF